MNTKLKKIVLDLETQKEFAEVGGRGKPQLLKISVCGIYHYPSDKYMIFEENELPRLAPLLQEADQIIGFNNKNFDHEVLKPYLNFDLDQVPYLDILQEVEKVIGHRVSLDSIAKATLGEGKNGNGKEAILFYRQGRMDLLKKYCLRDVQVTRMVYEYALKNNKVLYQDYFAIKEIPLQLNEAVARANAFTQAVLF